MQSFLRIYFFVLLFKEEDAAPLRNNPPPGKILIPSLILRVNQLFLKNHLLILTLLTLITLK